MTLPNMLLEPCATSSALPSLSSALTLQARLWSQTFWDLAQSSVTVARDSPSPAHVPRALPRQAVLLGWQGSDWQPTLTPSSAQRVPSAHCSFKLLPVPYVLQALTLPSTHSSVPTSHTLGLHSPSSQTAAPQSLPLPSGMRPRSVQVLSRLPSHTGWPAGQAS